MGAATVAERTPVLVLVAGLRVGGAETMLVNVVNRLDRDRFDATVASLHEDNPLAGALAPGTPVVVLARSWRFDLGPARRIARLLSERRAGVVLCFGMYEFFFLRLALWGRTERPRIVISIHSTGLTERWRHLQHLVYARFLTRSETIAAVCLAQADYWTRVYRIPRQRFAVVYNGIDTDFFAPSGRPEVRSEVRRRYSIPEDALVILQVASLNPYKRHEDALEALHRLESRLGPRACYLMLVGTGPPEREASLRRMAAALGIEPQVIFCGAHADVRPFQEAADLFTLTSEAETFSVAALEAMAMGLPVVLTDVGGAREMVEEGVNGFLAPRQDPEAIAEKWFQVLRESSMDPASIRRIVVERFGIATCVRAYEDLLAGTARSEVESR